MLAAIRRLIGEIDLMAYVPRRPGVPPLMTPGDAALQAAYLLVMAYKNGAERGGSLDWEDLDRAYAAAREALRIYEAAHA